MALTKTHNRMIEGSVANVLDFGAVGDGTTDDSAAIQAALNASDVVYFPPTSGGYKVSGTGLTTDRIVINGPKKLIGDERQTKIVHSNDEWLFELNGSDIEIDGFFVDSTAATTAARGFAILRSDLSSMENIRIKNIETYKSRHGIRDVTHASNLIIDMALENVVFRFHNGPGFSFERASAYIRFNGCTVDYVNGSTIDYTAYSMQNNSGSTWINCDVTGGTVDGTTTNQKGFYFDDCVAVWMINCMADTVGSYGFHLDTDCESFYFVSCVASLCGGSGWLLGATVNGIQMTGCLSSGRKGQAYAPANQHGFHSSANATILSNCRMTKNTGNGIYFQAGTRYNISGGRFDDNGAYGLKSDATSSGITSGASFDVNVTNNAQLSSTYEHIVNCQASSGALINLSGAGTV